MDAFNPHINNLPIPYNLANIASNLNNGMNIIHLSNLRMDSRIWSRLPVRLLDRVIAFLPPQVFFRFRAVCKRWYALLFSNNFLELYLQVSPKKHWFIFFKQKTSVKNMCINNNNNNYGGSEGNDVEGYLFDPYESRWFRVSFPLIPQGYSPASSSGGLVCWISDVAGCKNILLNNPLMLATLTALPSTLRPRLYPSIGLSITNSSIDVAIAGDDLISPYAVKNLSSECFHIDSGGFYSIWGTTSSLPRLCSLESGRLIFVGGGRFYCMNYSPFSVLCYEIGTNHWCKIQAPMRRFLRSPNLIECNGKLILVAAVEKSKLNVPKSLRLWALMQQDQQMHQQQQQYSCCDKAMWVEIERMPQQLYVEFAQVESGNGFECVGNGEFVVIFVRGSSDKAVMFDFCKKRWQWIPPCPYIIYDSDSARGGGGGSNGGIIGGGAAAAELHGFAYEPRLATPVTALLDQLTLPFQSFN